MDDATSNHLQELPFQPEPNGNIRGSGSLMPTPHQRISGSNRNIRSTHTPSTHHDSTRDTCSTHTPIPTPNRIQASQSATSKKPV
ncbi:hypothetical protein N7466_006481 [Penicillium verhagenii]|uniref:uncharacterized protein n=1 Tax=Penicillium verhagenii TaxID=1562060 RepID=UPI0025457773|nr:uncharacterized protein N7466_006481 [Penicillium verhagenii]KAJ5930988.1 hypothetical protein N7466_006481 [Penicillium verhagenii]